MDTVVTLPCNFTTNTYETPRITWFRYRKGERRQIMKFEDNHLTSYGELSNRVARGDRGALVLIRPTVGDSGNYSCEVEVEGESPNWVMVNLYLEVKLHDVQIRKVRQAVTAKESDSVVVLPCDYKTDGPVTPRVTWCQVKNGERKDIVVFEEHGGLSVDTQFVNRVARGKRGALVLISPAVEDSGLFSCAVQTTKEKCVTNDISLVVSSKNTDMIFLICVLWIFLGVFGFILEGRVFEQIKHLFHQKMSPKMGLIKGWRCIPVLFALCLLFTGTIYSAKALTSRDTIELCYYKTVAYGTGISGIVILSVIYICFPLNKMSMCGSCRKETNTRTFSISETGANEDLLKETVVTCPGPTQLAALKDENATLKPKTENTASTSNNDTRNEEMSEGTSSSEYQESNAELQVPSPESSTYIDIKEEQRPDL